MRARDRPLRVVVVAEYYPRPGLEAWGIWAHRQAQATVALGTDLSVLALDRPLPSLYAVRSLVPGSGRSPTLEPLRDWAGRVRALPATTQLDGIPVRYVRFVAPPRPISYARWGRWAARPLGRALDELYDRWPFDLVHAHYAIPAADACRRWIDRSSRRLPLMVSVHGGDLSYAATRSASAASTVGDVLRGADLVAANSTLTKLGVERLAGPIARLEVIHPGADVPLELPARHRQPTLVTVAHLEAHKNQQGVIRAVAALKDRYPDLRYVLIGDGPDRSVLEQLARSLGVADRVEFLGALPHEEAMRELARCHVHVMPSLHDAFGVAHIEAMAAGLVAVGGSATGAEDIAAAGEGIVLVPSGDVEAIAGALNELLADETALAKRGEAARETVERSFSWSACGRRTLAAYEGLLSS